MKLHRLDELSPKPFDTVFRESRVHKAIGVGLMAGLTSFPLAMAIATNFWIAWAVAIFMVLLTIFYATCLTRAFSARHSWLIRHNTNGLLIKFRSYMNGSSGDDQDMVAATFEWSDLEWVRKVNEERIVPGTRDSHQMTQYWVFLDLKLKLDDAALYHLEACLDTERERMYGGKFMRSKAQHYPVRLMDGGILRIDFRSPQSRITPPAETLIELLRKNVEVQEAERRKVDAFHIPSDPAEQDALVRHVAQSGDLFNAVRLVRLARKGSTLATAREQVQTILRRDSAHGESTAGHDQTFLTNH